MDLSNLNKIKGNKSKRARVGRGIGSGSGGHTVGAGMKGQNSRAGSSKPFAFEGGQVPLYKRLPQIGGFRNPTKKDVICVVISKLNLFNDGDTVSPKSLLEKGIIKRIPKNGVKILDTGMFNKKLTLTGFLASKGATEKILKSGSELKLGSKKPLAKKPK